MAGCPRSAGVTEGRALREDCKRKCRDSSEYITTVESLKVNQNGYVWTCGLHAGSSAVVVQGAQKVSEGGIVEVGDDGGVSGSFNVG